MSTSKLLRPEFSRGRSAACGNGAGLSVIELLIALALGLSLALGVAPLWTSFQALGGRETDKTIWALQGRVAAARLERDLRSATAEGCPFVVGGPVLQATASQVVMLVRKADSMAPILVEWELVAGSLMRRWGPCPAVRPLTYPHSLYSDSKTMLEGIASAASAFGYDAAGTRVPAPIDSHDLMLVDGISLLVASGSAVPGAGERIRIATRVGR